jgi:TonB family protein
MPIIVAVSAPAPAFATAAPIPSGSCTVPDSEARIDHLAAPLYTEAMKQRHKAGTVDVDVELLPNGAIAKAVVVKSSGDDLLDAATYQAAITTTYIPEVRGCTYLAGSYIFRARYRVAPSSGTAPAVPIAAGPPAFPPIPVKSFGPVPYAPGAIGAAASPAPITSPSPSPSPTHH